MEVNSKESRIITPFLPSLLHLATVKVGLLLKSKFDYSTLKKAHKSIQEGALIDFDEINKDLNFLKKKKRLLKCIICNLQCEADLSRSRKTYSAKRKTLERRKWLLEKRRNLLGRNMFEYFKTGPLMKQYKAQQILNRKIPTSLRPRVIEAVQGMDSQARWFKLLCKTLELTDEESKLYWKSDGSFDETETASQMALNENINVRFRFRIASDYCLEEIMPTIWSEMEQYKETKFFETDYAVEQFWIRKMLTGDASMGWRQDFRDYIHCNPDEVLKFVHFFPFLPPEDREVFLPYLKHENPNDFRRCINVMTIEEEKRILKMCPDKLLHSFLKWPYRSMFLETADKMWNYIDRFDFLSVLECLFLIKKCQQYDISDLFLGFWEKSPKDFRRFVKSLPYMKRKIKSWLKEIRQKRKNPFW